TPSPARSPWTRTRSRSNRPRRAADTSSRTPATIAPEVPMHAAVIASLTLAAVLVSSTARAQAPASPADGRTVMTAAEVTALAAKLKAEHKDQATMGQAMLRAAGFSANMEYRTAVGPAAVHDIDAEFFYVIDGSGTVVTGGKLANEKRTNAANLTGTGIEG